MQKSVIETLVGFFILAGAVGLMVLAFKVSGLANYSYDKYYTVTADFDNVGNLKVRAPVNVGGVKVGQVESITLDKNTFRAHVTLRIDEKMNNIPSDTSASIFTEGLLGSNYVSLTPGFDEAVLKEGSKITDTHQAIILENLIGQLLFSFKDGKDKNKNNNNGSNASTTTTGGSSN